MAEFHDALLREALEHCGPIIEGYEGRLDAASSDIKKLEAYLDGKVDEPVVLELSCEYRELPREQQGTPIEGIIERLVYMQRGGTWRLCYVRSWAIGHLERAWALDETWPEWTRETPLDRRPLIETPGETRLRAVKKLPEFVRAVARLFTIDPQEVEQPAEPDYGDIPF